MHADAAPPCTLHRYLHLRTIVGCAGTAIDQMTSLQHLQSIPIRNMPMEPCKSRQQPHTLLAFGYLWCSPFALSPYLPSILRKGLFLVCNKTVPCLYSKAPTTFKLSSAMLTINAGLLCTWDRSLQLRGHDCWPSGQAAGKQIDFVSCTIFDFVNASPS